MNTGERSGLGIVTGVGLKSWDPRVGLARAQVHFDRRGSLRRGGRLSKRQGCCFVHGLWRVNHQASASLPIVVPYPCFPSTSSGAHTSTSDPVHHASRVLNRHSTVAPDACLHHGLSEQSPSVACANSQLLTCSVHGVPLPFKFELSLLFQFVTEQLPCTMYGPMSQTTSTREAERSGHECCWVVEMVTNESYQSVSPRLLPGAYWGHTYPPVRLRCTLLPRLSRRGCRERSFLVCHVALSHC